MLLERASTTGKEIPTEVYTNMHRTDECLSSLNPYLACTIHPGGMDEIIDIHAIQDDTARKVQFAQAVDKVRQLAERSAFQTGPGSRYTRYTSSSRRGGGGTLGAASFVLLAKLSRGLVTLDRKRFSQWDFTLCKMG